MPSDASWIERAYNRTTGPARALGGRLEGSYLGRQLKLGFRESVGFYYEGMGSRAIPYKAGFKGGAFTGEAMSHGFLGLRGSMQEIYGAGNLRPGVMGKVSRAGRLVGKTAFKAMGALGTGYFMYEGYQQGGVLGAAKGFGESVLWSTGIRAVAGVLGNPLTMAAGGVAAAAGGYYMMGEVAKAHEQRLSGLEFGASATMRQRSVSALQNTHLNSRMALGNEASLMHM